MCREVVDLSFSRKKLFKTINNEVSYRNPGFIRYALSKIDTEVDSAVIDDSFCNEYYKLKKKVEVIDANFLTIFLSVLISGVFSLVNGLTTAGLVLVVIALLILIFWLLDYSVTKQGCVLEPYLLKCMEDKIACSTIESPVVIEAKRTNKCICAIKRFAVNNRVLTILTCISAIITISYTLTSHMPELIPGAGKWYKLSNDLSIGILINFVFYLFQIYIPQQEAEKNAFPAIKPELIMMIENIQEIMLVLEHYLPDYRYGKFNITDNVVHYMLQSDAIVRKGWSRQFDLYRDFTPIIKSIDNSLDKLLSSVFLPQCDKELIELLGRLRLNGFLKTLKGAEKDRFDSDGIFGDFKKYHTEFTAIYERLKRYAEGYTIRSLSPLNEKEIEQYFKGISIDTYREKGILHIFIDATEGE